MSNRKVRKSGKKVCGVGVNDADYHTSWINDDGRRVYCKYYRVWLDMIARCYSDNIKYKNYKDCFVCDEWLYFMTFRAWMEKQNWRDKHLDKDILVPLNREYSPQNCIFVEAKINTFLIGCETRRGDYPIGVNWNKQFGMFRARCQEEGKGSKWIGYFECPNEAHEAWRTFKHELACKYAEQQTDPRIAHALRQWYKPNGWYLLKEEKYNGHRPSNRTS